MAYHTAKEVAQLSVEAGHNKTKLSVLSLLILGFLAGAYIALGFLLDIRVTASLPAAWGSLSNLIGGAVFPVGLILVLIAGGELLTGNMMTIPIALFSKKATFGGLIYNWFWVTISNFIGSIFVAYFFGHLVGMTESGPFLAKTVAIAGAKLHDTFGQAFFSAVGCNWLVTLAVWLCYSSTTIGGRILGTWFPIMAFVAIGFQHVVANMFVIPAAIFAGHFTWGDYFNNLVPVYLGNVVGGVVFVSLAYYLTFIKPQPDLAKR